MKNIPITIQPAFYIVALLLGFLNTFSLFGTACWFAIIFVSILVHEYGHALTAVAFGQKARIELMGWGGLTHRWGTELRPWKDFIIVLNGPLAGLTLAFFCMFIYQYINPQTQPLLSELLQISVFINIFWTILNLLPIQPMDGGKLLLIFLEGIWGLRGAKIAFFISMILAVGFAFLFFFGMQYLIGAIFLLFAYESWTAWKELLPAVAKDRDVNLQDKLRDGLNYLHKGNREMADHLFDDIIQVAPKGVIYNAAAQGKAEILAEQGHFKEAYQLLLPLRAKLMPQSLALLQHIAFRLEEWEVAVTVGEKAYQEVPSSDIAFLNALSYALLGKARQSVGWLRCAIRDGMPNAKHVVQRHEFDAIRETREFQDLVRGL